MLERRRPVCRDKRAGRGEGCAELLERRRPVCRDKKDNRARSARNCLNGAASYVAIKRMAGAWGCIRCICCGLKNCRSNHPAGGIGEDSV